MTVIHYELPSSAATIRIRIYDSAGRLVRSLAENEPSGSRGDLIWDGFDNSRKRARIGIYFILLEALDGNGGAIRASKSAVVVAAKM